MDTFPNMHMAKVLFFQKTESGKMYLFCLFLDPSCGNVQCCPGGSSWFSQLFYGTTLENLSQPAPNVVNVMDILSKEDRKQQVLRRNLKPTTKRATEHGGGDIATHRHLNPLELGDSLF